ncbi:MAG: thermonuclease family protein [Alphaproteobacteria bacterium]|nr:thermonuclease family protein [Alphaproteobacteria bacterium]
MAEYQNTKTPSHSRESGNPASRVHATYDSITRYTGIAHKRKPLPSRRSGNNPVIYNYIKDITYAAVILAILLALPSTARAETGTLTHRGTLSVIDGDTIYIGDIKLRLLCLDAVELHQTCLDKNGAEYACGDMALQALQDAIADRPVTCKSTAQDKYSRPLANCQTDSGDLSYEVVKRGWAISSCKSTKKAEEQAKAKKLGIWQGSFEIPWKWRRSHPWKPKSEPVEDSP